MGAKRDYYEGLRVGEYLAVRQLGEFYGFTLRGYRLEGDRYRPIPTPEIRPGEFQGYSAALNANLRAADGYLGWHDPATGEHIPTLVSETARAETAAAQRDAAEAQRDAAREARITAQARADAAEAQLAAERARVRQLEAQLRQQGR